MKNLSLKIVQWGMLACFLASCSDKEEINSLEKRLSMEQIKVHLSNSKDQNNLSLQFDFKKQNISPNTRHAHRLIWFAKKHGKQIEMKEALMKAYFEEGIDLTKTESLISIASKVGLDSEKIKNFLKSTEGFIEVTTEEMQNAQRGISGVPFYIINNQYGVSGAQPSEVFAKAFLEISGQSILEGDVCDVESKEC